MLQIRLKLTDNFFAPKYNPIPYFSQKSSREGWVHDKHWLQLRPTRQTSKTKNQTALSYRYSEEVAYTLQKCKLLHLHAKSQFALKWQWAPAGSQIRFYCWRKKFRCYIRTGAKTGSFNDGALETGITETGGFYPKSSKGNAAPCKCCNKITTKSNPLQHDKSIQSLNLVRYFH